MQYCWMYVRYRNMPMAMFPAVLICRWIVWNPLSLTKTIRYLFIAAADPAADRLAVTCGPMVILLQI